jgi:hypothetical protein
MESVKQTHGGGIAHPQKQRDGCNLSIFWLHVNGGLLYNQQIEPKGHLPDNKQFSVMKLRPREESADKQTR